jgi:hypothetical protein
MRTAVKIVTLMTLLALLSCNFPLLQQEATPTATASPEPPTPTPRDTAAPTDTSAPTTVPEAPRGPVETIMILEPGPGSRLTSPIHLVGRADPTFEQTLGVRIVLDDGTVLTQQPAMIAADIGQRGPFEADVPFSIQGERNALIQVFDQSARDGGITHLASVGVTLVEGGPVEVRTSPPEPEAIVISAPESGASLSGGMVHVEGVAIASFEGTLLVEIYDLTGSLIGSEAVTVSSPEMGTAGPFSVDVTYLLTEEGPGRVVVVDPLPAFDGVGHIASVEVTLGP